MDFYSLWLPSQVTRFECQKCGEGWASQPASSRHMQLNECLPMDFYSLWLPSQETRFECQKCGEGWASQPAFSRHMQLNECLPMDFYSLWLPSQETGSSVRSAVRGGPASRPSRATCSSTSACLWIFILCDCHLRRPGSSVRSAVRGGPASQPSRDTCSSTNASPQRRPSSASHAAKVLAISVLWLQDQLANCIKEAGPWDFICMFSLTVDMDIRSKCQCLGSGSLWIRTNFGRLHSDPDPHWECGYGSRFRRAKMTHKNRKKLKSLVMFWRAEWSLLRVEGLFVAWTSLIEA